jgi:hypothetical protein
MAAVILKSISAHKASRVGIVTLFAAWAARAGEEATKRAGTAEVLPQPTKAEGQAQEGDVDGVERGVAAHAFAAAHAPRQRKAN